MGLIVPYHMNHTFDPMKDYQSSSNSLGLNYNINTPFFMYDTSLNPYYSPDFYYELDFTTTNECIYENLGWMMGFRKTKYTIKRDDLFVNPYTQANTGNLQFPAFIKSEGTFGSNYSRYLYFEVEDYNNNCQATTMYAFKKSNSFISNNILAKITLNQNLHL